MVLYKNDRWDYQKHLFASVGDNIAFLMILVFFWFNIKKKNHCELSEINASDKKFNIMNVCSNKCTDVKDEMNTSPSVVSIYRLTVY